MVRLYYGPFFNDKRAKTRKDFSVSLVYIYSGLNADKPEKFFTAKTCNISDSGISFCTNKLLLDGTCINIICKDLWDKQRVGMVRWHKTLSLNFYLVGVDLQ